MQPGPKVKLADYADLQAGFAFKSQCFTAKPEDVHLVKGENVGQGRILWNKSKRWPREEWEKYKKFHLAPQDVVVAMDRPWVPAGLKWAVIREGDSKALLVQRVARLRTCDEDKLDQGFLRYIISSPNFERYVRPITTGVNIPHISGRQILDYEFSLPPLEIQREIASILAAYDDLIEKNTRRIRILEEMAQSLYREWFVHFRFPGHEKARLVSSPLGKIPEGWTFVKFTDVAEVLSGGTPKTKEESYWGGDIPFFTPKDVANSFYVTGSEKTITELGLSKCSSKLYPKDTVFITARGTVGKVVMPATEMAMNQSCYALVGKDGISQLYLFFLTRQETELLKKNTGGATFDTIIVDTFKRLVVLKPETEMVSLFTQQVEPIFQSIRNLLYKNINLCLTRDLLLPKLVSGELDVSNLMEGAP